jgi:hypothetical protein
MEQHLGKTLQEANITLDKSGPQTRLNILTWYFYEKDPGSFYYYEKQNTPITNHFLHKAATLP